MVSKKELRIYNYKSIDEFFGYIIDSKTNGQHKQVIDLIKRLSGEQKLAFSQWLDMNATTKDQIELKNLLIEILLKQV